MWCFVQCTSCFHKCISTYSKTCCKFYSGRGFNKLHETRMKRQVQPLTRERRNHVNVEHFFSPSVMNVQYFLPLLAVGSKRENTEASDPRP